MIDGRFALVGLIIGFLIGLTGMGGGSLMTPVMILILGVKPLIAVGTDLAYGAITKIVGGVAHYRLGTVHRRTALLLSSGSVPATLLGVGLIAAIKQSHPGLIDHYLMRAVAWALILVALALFGKPFLRSLAHRQGLGDVRDGIQGLGERRPWMLVPLGALVGFLVGLTSVGGGTLVIAAFFFLYPRWEAKDMVGTDVFHAALLGSVAGVAHFAAGDVNMGMMLSLLLGSVPGVLIGSRFALGFPERYLRFSMATVMLISGAKLL